MCQIGEKNYAFTRLVTQSKKTWIIHLLRTNLCDFFRKFSFLGEHARESVSSIGYLQGTFVSVDDLDIHKELHKHAPS